MLYRSIVTFASGVLFFSAAAVTAQRLDREPRNGACFYEDVNYGGDHFCVRAGESLERMPRGMNDRVSSIRTFGRAEVQAYRNYSLEGRSARIGDDVPDLRRQNWNDQISSVEVRRSRYGDRGRDDDDRSSRSASGIVRRAYLDILGREPDAEGLRYYRGRVVDDGWSETEVREDLRRSGEAREGTSENGMTRARAENIVRNAYRSVLSREPDRASDGYVEHVLRDGWTQEDVEHDLRRSREFRNRNR